MPKTILVTGAAGFIGSSLSEKLLRQGDTVIGLDCLNDSYDPLWKQDNVDRLAAYEGFTFVKGDILDEALLDQLFADNSLNAVVHLAARAGVRPSIENPKLYETVNIRGSLNVLEAMRRHSVRKLVFASSSSVYGNRREVPFSEDDRVDFPVSPYAATKKAGEELCYAFSHLYGISVTCLRFFNAYGPHGRPDMAPYLFTEAILRGKPIKRYGDGNTRRDWTYIDDIVAGITAAIAYAEPYDVFNLGNSNPIALNDFIDAIERATGKEAIIEDHPMQAGDVLVTYADIRKAKRLLGYDPQTKFSIGISNFVEWFMTNRLKGSHKTIAQPYYSVNV